MPVAVPRTAPGRSKLSHHQTILSEIEMKTKNEWDQNFLWLCLFLAHFMLLRYPTYVYVYSSAYLFMIMFVTSKKGNLMKFVLIVVAENVRKMSKLHVICVLLKIIQRLPFFTEEALAFFHVDFLDGLFSAGQHFSVRSYFNFPRDPTFQRLCVGLIMQYFLLTCMREILLTKTLLTIGSVKAERLAPTTAPTAP